MVGVIWVVQVVVYPAFLHVPPAGFRAYERNHQRRMSMVLAVFAPAELITALLVFVAPGDVPRWLPFVAGAVLAGLWISTGAYYAPLHGRLAEGYDEDRIRVLIRTNWARTAGWTTRGILAAAMLVLAG